MMQKNLTLGSLKGQSRGVMGGLPVTGPGSPSRKTPQALQEGPQGPPALVWNWHTGRNSVLKGFRCHEKDFRICPVASHWRILGRRITCSGWVLESSFFPLALQQMSWGGWNLSVETSLEAMGIHIQTGDSRKKRVGGFRITGGDESQPGCQPWGRGPCSRHRVGWISIPISSCEHPKPQRHWWYRFPEGRTVNSMGER